MTSLLFKLLTFPLGVLAASWIFANVNFNSFYEPLMVGIVAAAVGVLLEYVILRKGTLWISTFSDVIVGWVLIYMVANLFEGAYVTVWGALFTSLIIAVVDYFIHYYLLKKGLAKKHA